MKLTPRKPDITFSPKPEFGLVNQVLRQPPQQFQADTLHLGTSQHVQFDEALLLCQTSENEWVAWIPDHGEAVLNTRQFCARR